MAAHRFKTSFGQCECLWCGRSGRGEDCAVTHDMRLALQAFIRENGRTWKSKLIAAWTRGDGVGPELQQVRNVLGPTRLLKLRTEMVDDYRLAGSAKALGIE